MPQIVAQSDPRYQGFITQGYTLDSAYGNQGGTVRLLEPAAGGIPNVGNATSPVSDIGDFNGGAITPVASSDPYRTTLKKLEDSISKLSDTTAQDKLYQDQKDWLTLQRDSTVAGLEKQYAGMRQDTEGAQKNETGSTSARLAKIGGYLGGSGSELGVMTNLEQSHRKEIQRLEEAKASAIAQARRAYDAESFALAQKQLDSAKSIEQEIYNRNNDYLNTIKDYDTNLAKDSRDAFKFALDNNIKSPYYTLDGVTIWDAATGKAVDAKGIDKSQIQTITPEAEVEFETRTVDGKIVRFGFDSQGNVVSRTELGRTGSTGSKGSPNYGDETIKLTKSERSKADAYIAQIDRGAKTLDEIMESENSPTITEYLFNYYGGEEGQPVEEEVNVRIPRLQSLLNSRANPIEKAAAQILMAEEEGYSDEALYAEVLDELMGHVTTRNRGTIQSKLNQAIEKWRAVLDNL